MIDKNDYVCQFKNRYLIDLSSTSTHQGGHTMAKKHCESENFTVDDMVEWKKPRLDEPENQNRARTLFNCIHDHGSGPFTISKVQNIPLKKTRDLRKCVGHHQFVWIDDVKQKFSGTLFKKSGISIRPMASTSISTAPASKNRLKSRLLPFPL